MHVAMCVDSFPTLTETWIIDQVVELLGRGVRVTIFAYPPRAGDPAHPAVREHDLLRHVVYRPERKAGRAARLVGTPLIALRHLGAAPLTILRTLNVPRYGWRSLTGDLTRAAIPMLRDPGRESWDLIHCHHADIGLLLAILKSMGALRQPLLTTFHGPDVLDRVQVARNLSYRPLIEHGTAYTAGSEFVRRRAAALGFDDARFTTIPQGIVPSRWRFRERTPGSDGVVRLLSIARLTEFKGIEYGLRALALVVGRHPGLRLEIVGDGPLRGRLEALTDELRLRPHVEFRGMITSDKVAEALDAAHLLLHPAIETDAGLAEAQGVALQEAQACGLPVVACRSGGIPESVSEGRTAVLAPPRDPAALAAALTALLDHPERWPQMGREGRAFVEERFALPPLVDRLLDVYRAVAQRRG